MILYAFLIALPMQLAAWFHPMHVSVTEIEMDEKEKRLEIMMRVFIDDLEVTLRQNFKQPELDVLEPKGQSLDELMQVLPEVAFSNCAGWQTSSRSNTSDTSAITRR